MHRSKEISIYPSFAPKERALTKALLFISILLLGLAACQSSQATPTPTVDPNIDLDELPEAQASAAASGQAPNAQSGSGDLCSNPYIPAVEGAT